MCIRDSNKGAHDGVHPNQAVVDGNGVMGQVMHVGPFSAEVILITDAEHALPVQVVRNQLLALVRAEPLARLQSTREVMLLDFDAHHPASPASARALDEARAPEVEVVPQKPAAGDAGDTHRKGKRSQKGDARPTAPVAPVDTPTVTTPDPHAPDSP